MIVYSMYYRAELGKIILQILFYNPGLIQFLCRAINSYYACMWCAHKVQHIILEEGVPFTIAKGGLKGVKFVSSILESDAAILVTHVPGKTSGPA